GAALTRRPPTRWRNPVTPGGRIRWAIVLAARSRGCDGPAMSPRIPSSRRIVMVAFPGANAVDVIGPLEVFAVAGRLGAHGAGEIPAYTTEVVAAVPGPLETQSGIGLVASRALRAVGGTIDTLLVAGGLGTPKVLRDRALLSGLRRLAPRARRVGS